MRSSTENEICLCEPRRSGGALRRKRLAGLGNVALFIQIIPSLLVCVIVPLLVLVLLSTSVISGTFAKYTTSATVKDDARVAYWGFGLDTEISFDLFYKNYDPNAADYTVVSAKSDDVIAPGTSGLADFVFAYKK
jgi:hypothetical protein